VYLRRGEAVTAQETWVRCAPSVSSLLVLPPA
jgi:hypothetical protein